MATRGGAVHVVTTTRSYKGREYRTHLLRRSYREGKIVRNETLGNLSHLPDDLVDVIRRSLKGERFVSAQEAFEISQSRPHGHVDAVRRAMQRLGFDALIASQPSRERDLVCAMVAARVLDARTKLATTRWWENTTLAEDFGVAGADVDELYSAMDWLLQRQDTIERNWRVAIFTMTGWCFTTFPRAISKAARARWHGSATAAMVARTRRRWCMGW